jgi:hypothetical protein
MIQNCHYYNLGVDYFHTLFYCGRSSYAVSIGIFYRVAYGVSRPSTPIFPYSRRISPQLCIISLSWHVRVEHSAEIEYVWGGNYWMKL